MLVRPLAEDVSAGVSNRDVATRPLVDGRIASPLSYVIPEGTGPVKGDVGLLR